MIPMFLVLACAGPAVGEGIVFPADGGVVDVRDYGGKPGDGEDDTAAVQAALDAFPNGSRIVYLAAGEWLVTDTLRWADGSHGGAAQKRTILQGAGRDLTTVRVPDGAAGFGDAAASKAVIWTGSAPAQRFRNAVRDLTIDVGAANPGAVGLQFNASNQGCVRNVRIRAAADSGLVGLDLGHTNEIGPLLVKGLEVEGFEVGVSTKWPVNSNTFEGVVLRGQRKFGWWNYHQMVFVRGLESENAVPALFNEKDSWGTVTLVDSVIRGAGAGAKVPGVLNQRQMFLSNVRIDGYTKAVDHADKGRDKGDVAGPGLVVLDTSHTNVASPFRGVDGGTLAEVGAVERLPVKETPEVAWGDEETEWATGVAVGAAPGGPRDSRTARQAAIDSGAKTVYLPAGGNFKFTGEVEIRGAVERITGLEGRFFTEGSGVWRLVDGRGAGGAADAPVVVLERCSCRSGGPGIEVRHESARTLVVSSWIGADVVGDGTGDVFIEDLSGQLSLERPGQSAWCRQLNTESEGVMLRNRGGRLWVLGMKTEKVGTVIETTAGGVTEALGVFVYSNRGWDEGVPAFVIEDSRVLLAGINERNFNRRPVSWWFKETQGGVTKERRERAWVYVGGR